MKKSPKRCPKYRKSLLFSNQNNFTDKKNSETRTYVEINVTLKTTKTERGRNCNMFEV